MTAYVGTSYYFLMRPRLLFRNVYRVHGRLKYGWIYESFREAMDRVSTKKHWTHLGVETVCGVNTYKQPFAVVCFETRDECHYLYCSSYGRKPW